MKNKQLNSPKNPMFQVFIFILLVILLTGCNVPVSPAEPALLFNVSPLQDLHAIADPRLADEISSTTSTLAITPAISLTHPNTLTTVVATTSQPPLSTVLDLNIAVSKEQFIVGETGEIVVTITNTTAQTVTVQHLTVWLPFQFTKVFYIAPPESCYLFAGIAGFGQFVDCPNGFDIPPNSLGSLHFSMTAEAVGNLNGSLRADAGPAPEYTGTVSALQSFGFSVQR